MQSGSEIKCYYCGKQLPGSYGNKIKDTTGTAFICPECSRELDNSAPVICSKCGNAAGLVKSGRLPNGFEVTKNMILHSRGCPKCEPDAESSVIEEIEEYERFLHNGRI